MPLLMSVIFPSSKLDPAANKARKEAELAAATAEQ